MVWGDYSPDERIEIVAKVMKSPGSVDEIAAQYGMRATSLSRKIRQIKSRGLSSGDKYSRKIVNLRPDASKKVFVYSDTHFPIADPLALSAAIEICDKYKPDIVIGLGDALDAYHFSRFSKRLDAAPTIQREIDSWREWAEKLTDTATSDGREVDFYLLGGNHDARIRKSLSMVAALSDMEALEINNILGTKEMGWNQVCDIIYLNPGDDVDYPNPSLVFYHGDTARKWSGQSATALSEKLAGVSVVVGHAHRTGVVTRRTASGITKSYEVGCLCSMQVEYDVFPNWTHSVLLGTISPSGFDFFPVVIDRGEYYYDGQRYNTGGAHRS